MKVMLFGFLSLIFLFTACSDKSNPAIPDNGGKDSIPINHFPKRVSSYDSLGNLSYYTTYEYDNEGYKTYFSYFAADGRQGLSYSIEYNANKDTVKKTEYDFNGDLHLYYAYDYDNNNLCIKMSIFWNDSALNYYIIYEYNLASQKVKDTRIDKDDSIDYQYIYEYDANGDMVKLICLNGPQADSSGYNTFEYQSHLVTKESFFTSQHILFQHHTYEYNQDNSLSKISYFNSNDVLEGWTQFTHDSHGRRTRIDYYWDNRLKTYDLFEY